MPISNLLGIGTGIPGAEKRCLLCLRCGALLEDLLTHARRFGRHLIYYRTAMSERVTTKTSSYHARGATSDR